MKSTMQEAIKLLKECQALPPLPPAYSSFPPADFPVDLSPSPTSPTYQTSPANMSLVNSSPRSQSGHHGMPYSMSSTPQTSEKYGNGDLCSKFSSSSSKVLDDLSTEDSSASDDSCSRSLLKERNTATTMKKKIKEKLPERIYPITELFSPAFLEARKKQSVSRPNLATVLVRCFFKKEVWMTSNVNGKLGKNKLNPDMIAAIKVATFKMYPLESTENDRAAWRACRKAIDSAGRQLVSRNSKENYKNCH